MGIKNDRKFIVMVFILIRSSTTWKLKWGAKHGKILFKIYEDKKSIRSQIDFCYSIGPEIIPSNNRNELLIINHLLAVNEMFYF